MPVKKRKWIPKAEYAKQQREKTKTDEIRKGLSSQYATVLDSFITDMKSGHVPWWNKPWSTPVGGAPLRLIPALDAFKKWRQSLVSNPERLVLSQWDQWAQELMQCSATFIWPEYSGITVEILGYVFFRPLSNQLDHRPHNLVNY